VSDKKTKRLREWWVVASDDDEHLEPFEPVGRERREACKEDGYEFIHVREVRKSAKTKRGG
jgi:hypothetical protein